MPVKTTIATRKDFLVETMRGSGPGGQKRNKTDSCVRITHIKTGLSEYCCETKSQHQNRKQAFRRLAQKLVKVMVPNAQPVRFASGTEVIRTYNALDDRVKDSAVPKKFSYRQTVGKGDLAPIIAARRQARAL